MKAITGVLTGILFALLIGGAIYGVDTMNAMIASYTDTMPIWLKLVIALLLPIYIIVAPIAGDPLFFARRCFLKGQIWLKPVGDKKGRREPFIWELSKPSVAGPQAEESDDGKR